MESNNLKLLAFGELGFRVISNNVRPINTPDDLAGLKLRTPGSATRIMAFETLGAAPTPMNLGEVYLALQQGVLDGQENPLSVIDEMSFDEVQKYISITRHVYTPITLVMNGDTWNELGSELQAMVLEAAAVAREASRKLSDDSDASLLGHFEEQGIEINEADLDAFKARTEPIYVEIGEIVGPDFMEEAVAIVGGGG
jgi:tripartite ATP-independent transporter DctP family solute receptor